MRTDIRHRIGAVLLVLGTVQFLVAHLVVQSAWPTPYSWWRNYISDLGATTCGPILGNTVCSPLHAVMNTSFVLHGLLLIAGTVLTADAWRSIGRLTIWQAVIVIVGLSWIVVGLVPEDVSLTGHSVGALPIFTLGNIALLVVGASSSTRARPVTRRLAGLLGLLGVIGFALIAVANTWPDGLVGIGAAERLAVFPLQVWALVSGIAILRDQRRSLS